MDIYHFHHFLFRPNKFKIINMNIPIVKWTNPVTKEVFQDKVLRISKDKLILIFAPGFLLGYLGRDHQGLLRQEAAHA